jgi:hypothetical protein
MKLLIVSNVKCYKLFVTQTKKVEPDNLALSGPIFVPFRPYVHKSSIPWCHTEEELRIFPLLRLAGN